MTKNSLQRKRMTQAKAQTVTAWGAAPNALPAVKCVRLMKDAGRVLHDAIETLLPALTTTTTPNAKNKAEKKLRSALQLVSHFLETHGPSLHKSITSLASAATVRACEMNSYSNPSVRYCCWLWFHITTKKQPVRIRKLENANR
jgi:hypothetical protein